jgi:subtilisin family serine protease
VFFNNVIDFKKYNIFFCFLVFLIVFQLNTSFALVTTDVGKSQILQSNKGFNFYENNKANIDNENFIHLLQKTSENEIVDDQFIVVLWNTEVVNSLEKPSHIMDSILEQNKNLNSSSFQILNEFTAGFKGFTIKILDNKIVDVLRENPNVLEVVPDTIQENLIQAHLFRNDNFSLDGQVIPTGIDRVDADLSSTKSGDGSGSVDIDIAIMDTGISFSHPDLNLYKETSFVPGVTSGNDDNGHGTAVAGLAAAKDNNIGIVGVAPDARLWAIKTLNVNNTGFSSWFLQGYEYILQNADEIDVANFSFGGPFDPFFSPLQQLFIEAIADAGVVMVAAAGNSELSAGGAFFPQAFPETISTALMYDSDGKCGGDGRPLANTGTFLGGRDDTSRQFLLPSVDIVAPGADILSTYIGNSYVYFEGSSGATPIVSGAAALYLSNHPDATPEDVFEALKDEGTTIYSKCNGEGRGYLLFEDDPRHKLIQAVNNAPERNYPPLLYVGNF